MMKTEFVGLAPLVEGSHVGVVAEGVYLDLHNGWEVESLTLRRDAVIEVVLERIGGPERAYLSFQGVEEVAQFGGPYDGATEDWTLFGQIDVAGPGASGLAFALEVGVVRLEFRAREVHFGLIGAT